LSECLGFFGARPRKSGIAALSGLQVLHRDDHVVLARRQVEAVFPVRVGPCLRMRD
jgi:hypothetical protein